MMVEEPRWLSGRESEAPAYELVFLHEEPKDSQWSGFDPLDGRLGCYVDAMSEYIATVLEQQQRKAPCGLRRETTLFQVLLWRIRRWLC